MKFYNKYLQSIFFFSMSTCIIFNTACTPEVKTDAGVAVNKDSGVKVTVDSGDVGTKDAGNMIDMDSGNFGPVDSGVNRDSGMTDFDYITDAGGLLCPYGGEALEDFTLRRFEAENLTGTAGEKVGTSWLLWSEGKIGTNVILERGEYTFRVRLWEAQAGDGHAMAKIKMGPFTETIDVDGTVSDPTIVEFNYHLPADSYVFEVSFLNDFNDGQGGDRNLFVDFLDVQTINLCEETTDGGVNDIDAGTGVYPQLHNLEATDTPRFDTIGRLWPNTFGKAVISQWKDDKMAALSVTIDDNVKPDHQYWLDLGTQYNWKWTWFVISGKLDGERGAPAAYFASTSDIIALYDAGHDIQSHSVSHLEDESLTIEMEYEQSRDALATMLPNSRQLTMAYPNGWNRVDPESAGYRNDGNVAQQYYIATRGTIGLVENATKIDYMDVHKVSDFLNFFEPQDHWGSFMGMTDPYNSLKGRGWYVGLFHSLNDEKKARVSQVLDYVKTNEADIWVATFTDAALYSQEFATSQISHESSTATSYSFEVHDQMDDNLFDYPLTVKVRIPNDWSGINVSQTETSLISEVIEHEGNKYVLLQARPDKGVVTVSKDD